MTEEDRDSDAGDRPSIDSGFVTGRGRRDFLKMTGSAAGLAALAGCASEAGSDYTRDGEIPEPKTYTEDELFKIDEWRGSGSLIDDRPTEYTGRSMLDLPDLSGGELTVYLGGGEGGLYENLIKRIQNTYADFTVYVRKASSSQLANTIIEEVKAGQSPADVFWAIDAGSVGVVSSNDATVDLPDHLVSGIPDTYHPNDQWVGVMGRARSIPYNTDEFSESEIPNDIFTFAQDSRFDNAMGWAPTYGAFQAFVTAMRLINGESEARRWLNGMQEQGVGTYDNELVVANRVASGELSAGFGNHYYSRLVYEQRPDAPLDLAFTQNDAGALVNCSAAEVLRNTASETHAIDFLHHLLSIEAQEFLATRGYEYPLLPSVPPIGDLPTIDELNPPEFDLSRLANVEPTLQLLREVGAL